jgi:G3E family GTPase
LIELLTASAGLEQIAPPLQLTLVDVKRFGTRGWKDQMESDQILTATQVGFTWTDTVDEARSADVRRAVAQINPRAAEITPSGLVDLLLQIEGHLRGLADRSQLEGSVATPLSGRPHDPESHFASFQAPLPVAVDPDAFLAFLKALPPSVLRAKGIVSLTAPIGEKRSFQKVGDHAEISPCQLADPDDLEPAAIFIGVGMPNLEIRTRLRRL